MALRRLLSFAVATATATTSLRAQEPVRFSLAAPTAAATEPFTRVTEIAELRDGRVVVVDAREALVRLFGPALGDGAQLGRNGAGPREYQRPFGVVRVRADTLLIYDSAGRRYVRVHPDGSLGDDLMIPDAFLFSGGLAPPVGSDADGRLYWLGDVVDRRAPGGPKRARVQNLRRWMPGTMRFDTVAAVADHAEAMHAHRFHPFRERDGVVVAPDGKVGLIVASEFRLRWLWDGRAVTEGPRVPFVPVPVTAAERAAFRRQQAEQPASGVGAVATSGRAVASPAVLRAMENAYPDEMFPAWKPPFDAEGVRLAPSGDVWVPLNGPLGQSGTRVEILDATGRSRGALELPTARRLVALTGRGVYLARTDDDGFEWLERYVWPPTLR